MTITTTGTTTKRMITKSCIHNPKTMSYDMEVLVLMAEHMILRILQILNMEGKQQAVGLAEIRAIMGRLLLRSSIRVMQIPFEIHRPTRATSRDNMVRVGIHLGMTWIMGGLRVEGGSISPIIMIIDERKGKKIV